MSLRTYAVLILTAMLAGGCTDKSHKGPKSKTIAGIASKVDLTNNRVSMTFKDEKGMERTLEGTIREDTVVEINGRVQKLEDIHEGDKVEVSGFREGKGDALKLVATKIVATRPQTSDWKSTGTATSQPAGGAPQGKPVRPGRPAGSAPGTKPQ